jgi:hypothetical protein
VIAKPSAALLVATLLPLTCATDSAAAYERTTQQLATSVCQPTTPLQLGGLRQRPLGIYNNKPYAIYISCSLITQASAAVGQDRLGVSFYNSTLAAVDVTCTALGGSRTVGSNHYTGSVSVPTGTSAQLLFPQIDRKSESAYVSLSCLLPSGVEMGRIEFKDVVEYTEV